MQVKTDLSIHIDNDERKYTSVIIIGLYQLHKKGKKFKYKPLNNLLLSISNKPSSSQKEVLNTAFIDWQGALEQVDDVLIVGIKV